jgi:probable HAF family extracellular repeat protein
MRPLSRSKNRFAAEALADHSRSIDQEEFMEFRVLTWIFGAIFCVLLACSAALAGQKQPPGPPSLSIIDLGTLGGTFSLASGISKKGQVTGFSTLPGDAETHGFVWRNGVMRDLGTLGGQNSAVYYPGAENGQVTGLAEGSINDPLGEDFCGFGTGLICLPAVWRDNTVSVLPTLGGNNGIGSDINNTGQVVGYVENNIPDSTCPPPLVLHVEPVIWERGTIRQLPNIASDPDGYAQSINEGGQAVGGTGDCVTPFHAVLWENSRAIDLGNLGGQFENFAFDINEMGEIVGSSDIAGDTTSHAFLWRNGMMNDLGTLPGDFSSRGEGINERSVVVGFSADAAGNKRAFLWQNGVMSDLNALIPPDTPWFLLQADEVNDAGQIIGFGVRLDAGEVHAFLAIPNHSPFEGAGRADLARRQTVPRPIPLLPASARKLLDGNRRIVLPGWTVQ